MDTYRPPDIEFKGPPPFDPWSKGVQLARGGGGISPERISTWILIAGGGIFVLTQRHDPFLVLGVVVLVGASIVTVNHLEKRFKRTRALLRHQAEASPSAGVVSADGVRESEAPDRLIDWAQFDTWQGGGDLVVLKTPSRLFIFCPEMFRNRGDWSSFQRMVQQYVRQDVT